MIAVAVDIVPAEALPDEDLRLLANWKPVKPQRIQRQHLLAAVRNRFPNGRIPITELPESA